MTELYHKWLESCRQVDIPAITIDTAARLMSILYEYGSGSEMFTFSRQFNADREYIQRRFGLTGGEVPDATFVGLLTKYTSELEAYQTMHKDNPQKGIKDVAPAWVSQLLKERYNMTIHITVL